MKVRRGLTPSPPPLVEHTMYIAAMHVSQWLCGDLHNMAVVCPHCWMVLTVSLCNAVTPPSIHNMAKHM